MSSLFGSLTYSVWTDFIQLHIILKLTAWLNVFIVRSIENCTESYILAPEHSFKLIRIDNSCKIWFTELCCKICVWHNLTATWTVENKTRYSSLICSFLCWHVEHENSLNNCNFILKYSATKNPLQSAYRCHYKAVKYSDKHFTITINNKQNTFPSTVWNLHIWHWNVLTIKNLKVANMLNGQKPLFICCIDISEYKILLSWIAYITISLEIE